MIASLHGKLEMMNGNSAIINVNGIGFLVHLPASSLETLGNIGQDARLLTHMVVREDNIALYGFGSAGELELFQVLIGVSGVGPKLALSILSSMSVEQVCTAITSENINLLTSIPGIGKKTANRLVLELKDKISAGLVSIPAAQTAPDYAEVIAALTSLGYSISEASRAAATIPPSVSSLEDKIKLALQYFSD
jgi:holliday junction DNA helicase RuvA